MPKYSPITHTHKVSWDSYSVEEIPRCYATPEMPLNLEADLTVILISTADTSQWKPEDLQEWVSKLHSEKDTKIPLRRRMETAKLILSYFLHPSDKIGASPSQQGAERQGNPFQQGASFPLPAFSTFFCNFLRALLWICYLSCSQRKEKCSECYFIQHRLT